MSQSEMLITVLKKELKRAGITYRSLAPRLSLSEAAVKRMFSEGNFTIKRLNDICELMGIQFSDLTRLMEKDQKKIDHLSAQQEQQLASDERLLLIAFLVINGFTLNDIVDSYNFSQPQVIRYLVKLDKLNIIELLPNNKIRLIISSKFSWRSNGPIQEFFTKKLQVDFLAHPFNRNEEKHYFLTAMLSQKNAVELENKIESIVNDFKVKNLDDFHTPNGEKKIYSFLLAMRNWHPKEFDYLRKQKKLSQQK